MTTPMVLDRDLAFRFPLLSGEDVRAVQQTLIRAGAMRAEADGVFGPLTRDAVLALQRRAGLPADGVLRRGSWDRLLPAAPPPPRPGPGWREMLRPLRTLPKSICSGETTSFGSAEAAGASRSLQATPTGSRRTEDASSTAVRAFTETPHVLTWTQRWRVERRKVRWPWPAAGTGGIGGGTARSVRRGAGTGPR